MLYQIIKASVSLGGSLILDHIDFEIRGREKIALTGRNGAGKTTLLRLIAGEIEPDRDDKRFGPAIVKKGKISIGMLSQNGPQKTDITLREAVEENCPDYPAFDKRRYDYESECKRRLKIFGIGPEEMDRRIDSFSGGEQTKIALALLLMKQYDLLLLDEPTNHLDLDALRWLEAFIRDYPGAVVLVSHDRYFMDQTAEIIYAIEGKKCVRYPGNYSAYRETKRKNTELQTKKYAAYEAERKRLEDLISRFKHKPNKSSMARAKKKQLQRMEKPEAPPEDPVLHFNTEIIPEIRTRKVILELKKVIFGYDRPLGQIDMPIRRGRKIGVIGKNGAGKSCFLKSLQGQIPVLSGQILRAEAMKVSYFDQLSSRIDSEETVLEHFRAHFPGENEKDIRTRLAAYLFGGREAGKTIRQLSGGEKSRLVLAELIEDRPNLMLLDEPTNHMDILTMESLEAAWKAYKGSMIIVSHDRYLLREVVDSLLVLDGEKVIFYPFGYDHYEQMRMKEDQSVRDTIMAQNARLVEELHAVPDRERHQSPSFNTRQASADWEFSLESEEMKRHFDQLEKLDREDGESYELWIQGNYDEKREECLEACTRACILWYEKYLEYEQAFAHYREE